MSPRPKTSTISTAAIAFAEQAVAAKPEPYPIVLPAEPVSLPPCALAAAPLGAKCIVSRTPEGKKVRLLTPAGATELDPSDIFYTLPAGAKMRKVAENRYEMSTLGQGDAVLVTAATAHEAVTQYLKIRT